MFWWEGILKDYINIFHFSIVWPWIPFNKNQNPLVGSHSSRAHWNPTTTLVANSKLRFCEKKKTHSRSSQRWIWYIARWIAHPQFKTMSQSHEMLSRRSTHGIFLGFNIKRKKLTLLKKFILDTIYWTWSIFQILIHIFITKDSKTHSFHSHKVFEPWTFNFHNGTCVRICNQSCMHNLLWMVFKLCHQWTILSYVQITFQRHNMFYWIWSQWKKQVVTNIVV